MQRMMCQIPKTCRNHRGAGRIEFNQIQAFFRLLAGGRVTRLTFKNGYVHRTHKSAVVALYPNVWQIECIKLAADNPRPNYMVRI
jgi:hypothetical protein